MTEDRRKRLLKWAIGTAAAAGTAVPSAVALTFIRPWRHLPRTGPADLGFAYEDVSFLTEDGLTLRGWWVPAPGGRANVVFCHGQTSSRGQVRPLLPGLHAAGLNVLAFDFRAHGSSEGSLSYIGGQEWQDVQAAVRWCRTLGAPGLPVGVLGFSMGGAAALMAAADCPEIGAVWSDSAFARLDRAIRQHCRSVLGPVGGLIERPVLRWGERMLRQRSADVSPVARIGGITPRPVYLVHGSRDRLVLPEDARLLYAAAGDPKALWLIPGAGHLGRDTTPAGEYCRRLVGFFIRSLVPAG